MEPSGELRREEGFAIELLPGWEAEVDEEGGLLVSRDEGAGLLHLAAFEQGDGEMPDPGEELYAFLAEQEIELEEDDVDDVELAGEAAMSLCEYLAEGEDAEEAATYWLVAVATSPGNLVFANYSCPAGQQAREREEVRRMLASLQLEERP